MNLQDLLERSGDEDLVVKLKRDLKRTKALLKDAQLYMEKNQNDGTNKVIVRQLKNQVCAGCFTANQMLKIFTEIFFFSLKMPSSLGPQRSRRSRIQSWS